MKPSIQFTKSSLPQTVAASLLLFVPAAAMAVPLFEEDFEGLALGPNVDETVQGDMVWTAVPPAGWVVDNSGVAGIDQPGVGVTEWKGWNFADRIWWASVDDQRRSDFTNATGTVAIADPDEWDDLGAPSGIGTFNAFLSTPAISLAGIDANAVTLTFDSSFRPEGAQRAAVDVSYDGGAPVNLLEYIATSDDKTNERIVIELSNPVAASEAVITFSMTEAGNNWFWAIDNVLVTTDAVPICPRSLTSTVDTNAGTVTLNWLAAANIPGASLEVLRDETVIGQLALDAVSFTDTPPGTDTPETVVFDYQLRVVGGDNNCVPLDLTVLYKLGEPVMLAEWLLDENAGLVANNSLGPEHQGTFFTGPGAPAGAGQEPSWVDADFLGTGVELIGDGFFDIGDNAATAGLRPEVAVTVASWVKPNDFVEWAGIFNMAFDSGSQEAGYYLGTRTGDYHIAVTTETPGFLQYLRSPGIVGEWSYVVGVYDGTAIRLYINGVEVNSVAASGPILYQSTGGQVPLGGQIGVFLDDNEDIRQNATIAYVALWDGALGPDEIQQLYQSGLEGDFGGAPLAFTDVQLDTERGEVILTWSSRNGKTYAVDVSTDLIEWGELDDGVQSEGDSTSFTDGDPPSSSTAYYRVREL